MRFPERRLQVLRGASSALMATLVLMTPAVVLARDAAPPQPSLNNYPPAWIGYLLMFVLLIMVVGISLLPSKRGHQD